MIGIIPSLLRLSLPLALALQQGDVVRREVPSTPGGHVEFRLHTGASISVEGWSENRVTIEATSSRGDCAGWRDCELEVERSGAGVLITSRYTGPRRRNQTFSVEIRVRVPRRTDLTFSTAGGGIVLRGIEGRFDGRTMGGELDLEDLRGSANLSTMGGSVTVRRSHLAGRVSTMGGRVLIDDVTGGLRGSTMGGGVEYRGAGAGREENEDRPARGRDAREDDDTPVRINANGGDVNVPDAPKGAHVSTLGGTIHVRRASSFVKAHTNGGGIRIDAVDGWVEASTNGGDVTVRVVGAGGDADRHISLTSLHGNIVLEIPGNLPVDVEAEIAWTRGHEGDYRITSDVPLEQEQSDGWDRSRGTPRRYITGRGRAGTGRHRVQIETINGNITIRRVR